jgi:hypothetical protein
MRRQELLYASCMRSKGQRPSLFMEAELGSGSIIDFAAGDVAIYHNPTTLTIFSAITTGGININNQGVTYPPWVMEPSTTTPLLQLEALQTGDETHHIHFASGGASVWLTCSRTMGDPTDKKPRLGQIVVCSGGICLQLLL